ncbi:MAG: 8-oxoguanine deaminase [Synergistetes bacterium]|nr:8-oxoguanine deaminase [Synergistota bacterium]
MRILFKDFDLIFTASLKYGEIRGGYLITSGNRIESLGKGDPPSGDYDRVVDGRGKVLLPGFVNTHHHFFQALTRAVKGAQDLPLFEWLKFLYEIWKNITPEMIYISTKVAIAEMLLSGVTTSTDHLYLVPSNREEVFDAQIEAVKEMGIRFLATRGSMSLSREEGGLPPREVVQKEERILRHCEKLVSKYHDPGFLSTLRVALAPCSPFSVTPELMKETLKMAEEEDLLLHTHLAETLDEERYCLEKFGKRPVEYMEELGWLNNRVWFAHLIHLSDSDIEKLVKADVGMAHCPSSNMRLGSGIARVAEMKDKLKMGIALDGSASNDTNNFIYELRNAMLLQRVRYGADALTVREVLLMGTIGGARVLRMEKEIGSLEVGKGADLIVFNLNDLEHAGAVDDPLGAILLCDTKSVDMSLVNGRILVEDGVLKDIDLGEIIHKHNLMAKELLSHSLM